MEFNKTKTLRNLNKLENTIKDKIDEIIAAGVHVEDDFERLDMAKSDLVDVQALMEDIERDIIELLPTVEEVA